MLILVNGVVFSGFVANFLDVLFVVASFFGGYVVISKSPVVSVLFLIGLFLAIASYLMLSGITFIGLAYLLVYIGAVSILFLFIVMLINVRISELKIESLNGIPLAILVGLLLSYSIVDYITYYVSDKENTTQSILDKLFSFVSSLFDSENSEGFYWKTSFAVSSEWIGNLVEMFQMANIGNVLYGIYSIWLIVASVILLLAMVGSIVITIKSPSSRLAIASFSLLHIDGNISVFGSHNFFDIELYNNIVDTYLTNIIITTSLLALYPVIVIGVIVLMSLLFHLYNNYYYEWLFSFPEWINRLLTGYTLLYACAMLIFISGSLELDYLWLFSDPYGDSNGGGDPSGGDLSGSGDPNGNGDPNNDDNSNRNGNGNGNEHSHRNVPGSGYGDESRGVNSQGVQHGETGDPRLNNISRCEHPGWRPGYTTPWGTPCDFNNDPLHNSHVAKSYPDVCSHCGAVICKNCRA